VVVGDDEIPFSASLSSAVAVTRYPQRTGGWGLHSKYLLIDAKYAGSTAARRLVFTGSHNYTGPALTSNDETLLRIEDPAVFAAFLVDWGNIRSAALNP
jgi:phosphatidylserine/phosphatidylglycerophosphate/cardiolipin synthase-like enzyme